MVRPKILIYLDELCGPCDGITTWATNLCKEAMKYNIEILLYHSDPKTLPEIVGEAEKCVSKSLEEGYELLLPSYGLSSFLVARKARKNKKRFCAAYHVDCLSIAKSVYGVPIKISCQFVKQLYAESACTFVSNQYTYDILSKNGITNNKIIISGLGVDSETFIYKPSPPTGKAIYVGKVSRCKSIEDFLNIDIPYEKVVIGDGPLRHKLSEKYPSVQFLGWVTGSLLQWQYQNCDILVFPSKNDTFGLPMIEAASCGKPFAAYNTPQNIELLGGSKAGYVSSDLAKACIWAYNNHIVEDSLALAAKHSWKNVLAKIVGNINENKIDIY